jgi:TolB-like protein/DNA-binding winged helix-turn-helix (wHTH) protein/Tfp pilus assembly protein PilF
MGSWLVQPSLNTISRNGTTVQLEPKVMSVLVYLAEHPGEPVSKEQLLQTVWPDTFVGEGVLTRSIFELRRVFEDEAKAPRVIQTIAKRGYRLVAPVTPVNGASSGTWPAILDLPRDSGRTSLPRWMWRLAIAGSALLLVALLVVTNIGSLRERVWARTSAPQIHSLAVLPLKNLSGDPTQEYFAYGMTDELISALSQVSALKVISHTSARRYENTSKTLPQIAQELGVDGMVEGTVQRVGDRVRVSVQLINAPQDAHIWAQNYERDVRDVFGLESEVAQAIAQEVRARLTPREQDRLESRRPVNLDAMELYLQAQYHWRRADRDNFKRGKESTVRGERKLASELYQKALATDPGFAPAYVGLAYTYGPSLSTKRDVPKAIAALRRAIELDPQLADAHVSLGGIDENSLWDWTAAEREYKRAIELNANQARAHESYAYFLDAMGRMDEGMAEHQKAEQLEPGLDHMSGAFFHRHDFERSIAFEKTSPDGVVQHWFLGVSYERLGKEREAADEFQRVMIALGDEATARKFRSEYEKHGLPSALHLYAVYLEPMADSDYIPPFAMIYLYGAAGDTDRAFDWLERAYQLRADEMVNLKVSPYFDALRSSPRFQDYIRKVGLPQ